MLLLCGQKMRLVNKNVAQRGPESRATDPVASAYASWVSINLLRRNIDVGTKMATWSTARESFVII